MSESKKIAVVTGASGYIGSHVIRELSERGYHVRGTVRDTSDKTKTGHLTALFPSLELFEANLLDPHAFTDAFKGAHVIFHTASPFTSNVSDPVKDLVEPAIQGTTNVLNAALNSSSVKRIVLTSSFAAIRKSDMPPDYVFSEADWNTSATIEKSAYPYSKTQAELTAWKIMREHKREHDLIVINPTLVIGPPLSSRTDSESVTRINNIIQGKYQESGIPFHHFCFVDVRDVARAHVQAAEVSSAEGRYLIGTSESISFLDVASYIKFLYPTARIPTKLSNGTHTPSHRLDRSRAEKHLGIEFLPWQQSIQDMIEACIRLGITTLPPTS